jgi:hypothetical protein
MGAHVNGNIIFTHQPKIESNMDTLINHACRGVTLAAPKPVKRTIMVDKQYPRWRRRHEAVLAWLLDHPAGKIKDCAVAIGYSRWHVSRIVNSPDFKARYKNLMDIQARMVAENYIRRITMR